MNWKKLTPASKKQITSDWLQLFEGFCAWKPMHLLRRTGPLLSGILLERSSTNDSYYPVFHVHNLARVRPAVLLCLPRRIPYEYVHVEWHDAKFPDMAKRISHLAYIPLSGAMNLTDVMKGFQSYLADSKYPYEPDVYEDLALICGWCGNRAEVANVLREAESVMKRWPAPVLKQIGGLEQWLQAVRVSAENQDALISTTASQIAVHGVGSIPTTKLE